MGSELSCPCGDRHVEMDEPATKMDILQEVMRGKLLPEEVIFNYSYDHTKVCLIKTEQLEGFFNNRNLLKLESSKEVGKQ